MIVVNSSFLRAPFADVLFAGDWPWWKRYAEKAAAGEWRRFAGEKWTTSDRAKRELGCEHVRSVAQRHAVRMHSAIFAGVNSGHNAVALAGLFGASRIVLLGFDMGHAPDGRVHWHPDHPNPLGNGGDFPSWRRALGVLIAELRLRGTVVVNASRSSALTCCERIPLEEALCPT